MENGLRLVSRTVSAEFQPSRLVALRSDPLAGGWVSCEAVEPYAEHLLAVHPDLAPAVRRALEEAADPGWRLVRQSANEPLLAGFEVYRRVRFSDEAKLERALGPLHDYVKTALRPSVTARPKLGGGLPLLRGVATNCYLSGGEPDLYLPSGEDPRKVTVAFDGYSQALVASGFPLPFAIIPDIGVGEHVIEADGETLRFRVLARSPAEGSASGTGRLGWAPGARAIDEEPDAVGLRGTDLGTSAESFSEPILVRRGALEAWWLHRNGECTPWAESAAPPLLEELGLSSPFMEAEAPETAAWMLQRRHRGWQPPVLLRRLAPEFSRLDGDARRVLSEVFGLNGPSASTEESGLWALYGRAWELRK